MKRTLLTIAAIGAQAMVLPCLAADIGALKAPPVAAPAPVFRWSGCYAGGHLGGGWGEKEVAAPGIAPGSPLPAIQVVSLEAGRSAVISNLAVTG